MARAAAGVIFVSYRQDDDPMAAERVYSALAARFGAKRVFRDCDSMQAGQVYPLTIRDALDRARLVAVVIGPRWMSLVAPDGSRLVDRPDDWVRREISTALNRQIELLPVLVDGAALPAAAELPADIKALAYRQTFSLSHCSVATDIRQLIKQVSARLPDMAAWWGDRPGRWAAGAGLGCGAVAAFWAAPAVRLTGAAVVAACAAVLAVTAVRGRQSSARVGILARGAAALAGVALAGWLGYLGWSGWLPAGMTAAYHDVRLTMLVHNDTCGHGTRLDIDVPRVDPDPARSGDDLAIDAMCTSDGPLRRGLYLTDPGAGAVSLNGVGDPTGCLDAARNAPAADGTEVKAGDQLCVLSKDRTLAYVRVTGLDVSGTYSLVLTGWHLAPGR